MNLCERVLYLLGTILKCIRFPRLDSSSKSGTHICSFWSQQNNLGHPHPDVQIYGQRLTVVAHKFLQCALHILNTSFLPRAAHSKIIKLFMLQLIVWGGGYSKYLR